MRLASPFHSSDCSPFFGDHHWRDPEAKWPIELFLTRAASQSLKEAESNPFHGTGRDLEVGEGAGRRAKVRMDFQDWGFAPFTKRQLLTNERAAPVRFRLSAERANFSFSESGWIFRMDFEDESGSRLHILISSYLQPRLFHARHIRRGMQNSSPSGQCHLSRDSIHSTLLPGVHSAFICPWVICRDV